MNRATRLRPSQGGKFHEPVDARPRDVNGALVNGLTYRDDGMTGRWRPVSAPVALGFVRECCWCCYVGADVKPSYPGGDPECQECFHANFDHSLVTEKERAEAIDERSRQ